MAKAIARSGSPFAFVSSIARWRASLAATGSVLVLVRDRVADVVELALVALRVVAEALGAGRREPERLVGAGSGRVVVECLARGGHADLLRLVPGVLVGTEIDELLAVALLTVDQPPDFAARGAAR